MKDKFFFSIQDCITCVETEDRFIPFFVHGSSHLIQAVLFPTKLIPLHINKGKTAAASIKDRIDYAEDPNKTENGKLVASYECNSLLAWQKFMLNRRRYFTAHGSERESDVIGYQIRQTFKPGEITLEEANRIGYELAMRFTKRKHAFVVSTHIDRAHVHNQILFNAWT